MIKQVFRFSIGQAFRHSLEVWVRGWKLIVTLSVLAEGVEWISLRLLSSSGPTQQVFQGLWSLAVESLFLLIVPKIYHDWLQGRPYAPVWPHVKKHAEPFTIESLRVLGRLVVGLLLLILPFFIRMIQYYFVVFVVQFNSRYEKGELDALDASKQLVQGRWWSTFAVIVGVAIIGAVGSLGDMAKLSPTQAGIAFLLTLFLRVYTQVILYYFYELLVATDQHTAKNEGTIS